MSSNTSLATHSKIGALPAPPNPSGADRPQRDLDQIAHSTLAKAFGGLSPISMGLAYLDWLSHLAVSPARQMALAKKAVTAWTDVGSTQDATRSSDPRFSDEAWARWPFEAMAHGMHASEGWWREAVQVPGVAPHHQHLVGFFARQWLDAMSPSNWPWTNPEVMRNGITSGGQTLAQGGMHWLQDLSAQARRLTPEQLPPLPYQVGKDVAITPGKVVFRNHLIELIQYAPTTEQVQAEPLLIVPSCIMKYYILDLSPENSMVRYLVSEGFTVYCISWRNPDSSDRELGVHDYLESGVLAALGAVRQRSNQPRVHALGYCLGGTFLSIVAALLGRSKIDTTVPDDGALPTLDNLHGAPELASVTLLAAQTDFAEPGELGVFIDADQLRTLQEAMARTGYLSGKQMAASFQFLNARDLIWSRSTRRYLLGQDDIGNDMMSWNSDVTRLPERMHNEYLDSLFLNNALAAGHYRVAGQGVALMDINRPMLVVGTVRDHVSPWRSVYKIHLLCDAPITFVLAAGGHNAGIVSEPGHPRRSYQIMAQPQNASWIEPDVWQKQAPRVEGSWWPALAEFLRQHSSALVKAKPISAGQSLGDAPGEYVHVRYAD